MAKLKIVKIGDEVLRTPCRPVDKITPRTIQLLDDMIDTMHEANGCGLAAPQIGVLRRIAVVEVEEGKVHVLINPKIMQYLTHIAVIASNNRYQISIFGKSFTCSTDCISILVNSNETALTI